jgi:alpha-L-arabinofuranosidase
MAVEGFQAAKRAEVCTLSADLPWTGNTFEKPDAVKPSTSFADVKNNQLILVVHPYTLMRVRIPNR